ncbi:hypothetical protein ABTN45_18985, partial [Acinetobacter baumannii]
MLAPLLSVDRSTAITITGGVAAFYVAIGGMRSVIYTNVIHALTKYVGILIAMVFAISMAGGVEHLTEATPPEMFSVTGVG